jgi:acetyltransferase-like isoleucine patch superfamily enzyme
MLKKMYNILLGKLRLQINKPIIKGWSNIVVGSGVEIDNNAYVDAISGKLIVGDYTHFLPFSMIMTYGGIIEFGRYCTVNPFTVIYGHGNLKIGDAVRIAAHTLIIPANHVFEDREKPIWKQGIRKEGIVIEDDVWIGAGCLILDGIKIGKGAVIAAGTVVNKDVDPYTILGGAKARIIGQR